MSAAVFGIAPATACTLAALAVFSLTPSVVSAQSQAGAPVAGRVVFAIGTTQVLSAEGVARPATDGTEVLAGERVVTGAESYVHLRMVDQAFIAVRPASTLAIDLYDYDAANPKASRIRLQLDNGNTRTVSGRGGEAAKDRYRFNTPVAAIGLRGTDYTVRALDEVTRVSVARGAVAVTPLGGDCRLDTLGPCAGAATRELSAGLPHAYLQVSARQPVPELIAPDQDPAGSADQNPATRPVEPQAGNGTHGTQPEGPTQAGADPAATADAGTPGENGAGDNAGKAGNGNRPTQVANGPGPVTAETVSEITVDRLVTNPPSPAKLVWGRWSGHADGRGAPPMVALLSPDREITYGNAVFGLLRDSTTPTSIPRQGAVGFRLDASEAYVMNGGQAASARVLGGTLGIDFGQRAFDTTLAVSHAGGVEDLYAKGAVQATGLFASDSAASNMRVLGALARDASEAAYLFDKPLSSGGGLLGAVRWLR
ncbi:MAG: FecR domain-containing protein [Burkholderiaceae bacterium]